MFGPTLWILPSASPFTAPRGDPRYWSISTLTTVGYGDIAAGIPLVSEMAVAIFSMVLGASMIGLVVGSLGEMQAHGNQVRTTSTP